MGAKDGWLTFWIECAGNSPPDVLRADQIDVVADSVGANAMVNYDKSQSMFSRHPVIHMQSSKRASIKRPDITVVAASARVYRCLSHNAHTNNNISIPWNSFPTRPPDMPETKLPTSRTHSKSFKTVINMGDGVIMKRKQ